MALSPFRLLAREVRQCLCGHWSAALGILLLPAAVLVLYGYLAGYLMFVGHLNVLAVLLGVLMFLLIFRPLSLGVVRWWAALAAGHDLGGGCALHYFARTRYLSALKYNLRLLGCMLLRLLPYALAVLTVTAVLCFRKLPEVPSILLHNPSALTAQQLTQLATLLSDTAFNLGPLVFFLLVPLFFADALYVTRPNPTPIRDSARLYRRCYTHTISLVPRYFGWMLLSLFVLPLLYVLPYLGMTYAVFCKWMLRDHPL
jgi:hypothetical protein